MTGARKKEAVTCSLNGADTASFKLEQNYSLTQFSLQTHCITVYWIFNKETVFVIHGNRPESICRRSFTLIEMNNISIPTTKRWVFLAAGISATLIALITISFQSVKASVANPVTSLRSE